MVFWFWRNRRLSRARWDETELRLCRVIPKRDPRDGNFSLYRTIMIHTIYLFITYSFIYLFISRNKMHTVCRFCHYSSQVDRYAQFARAYYATDAIWATAQKIDYCLWRIKSSCVGVLDIFCKKPAKNGSVLLEQTAQALIRLCRYLDMQFLSYECYHCS